MGRVERAKAQPRAESGYLGEWFMLFCSLNTGRLDAFFDYTTLIFVKKDLSRN
jgi:hypothetical protein